MEKQRLLKAVQKAIKEDGRGPTLIGEASGLPEHCIRAASKGHETAPSRLDDILKALGRKLVLGRGKNLEI